MLKVWNVSLIVATFTLALLGTFLVRSGILESIHAFGASTVGGAAAGADRGRDPRLGGADRLAPRRPALGAADRVARLARGDLPGQQPAPGRALRGDLLGHLLPADLRGGHRRALLARLAVVRPLHDAARDRARAVHRDRPAARLAPGQRRRAVARWCAVPLAVARRGDRRGRGVHRRLSTSRSRWSCSRSRPSPSRRSRPEFWRGAVAQRGARRAAAWPPALGRVVARNRRRYGGYIVHAGIAIAADRGRRLVELPDQRATCACAPGETREVGDYAVTYVRADAARSTAEEQKLTFGAVLDGRPRRRARSRPCTRRATTTRRHRGDRAVRARLLRGRGDERGRPHASGVGGDLWTAMQPDLAPLDDVIAAVDARLTAQLPEIGPDGPDPGELEAMQATPIAQGEAIRNLAALYLARPPAGRLPRQRQPARDLDLARRRDRARRRPDRGLARARGPPPPRLRRLRGAPRARARPRLGRAPARGLAFRRVEYVIGAIRARGARLRSSRAPLRRPRGAAGDREPGEDPRRADLEARKEALYRQIRDAELDRAQGKLSDDDWRRLDAELRREAIELLKRIDAAPERASLHCRRRWKAFSTSSRSLISVDPDLPRAPALGQGRRALGRLRHRRRRAARSAAARWSSATSTAGRSSSGSCSSSTRSSCSRSDLRRLRG